MTDDRSPEESYIAEAELRDDPSKPAPVDPSVRKLNPDRAQIAALGNLPADPVIPPEIVHQTDLHARSSK